MPNMSDDCAEAQRLSEAILKVAKAELRDRDAFLEFDSTIQNLLKQQSFRRALKRIEELGFTIRVQITCDLKKDASTASRIETILKIRAEDDD